MNSFRTLALLVLLSTASLAAHADSISAGAVCPIALGTSADALSLNAASTSLASVVTQSGTFLIGDSGNLEGAFDFSFVDNITMDGFSSAVTIYGRDDVTLAADTLSIFASGPIPIGDATWSLRSFTLTGANIQPYAIALTADVTSSATPEPAGLALLGTGALATAFSIRRRLFSL